MPEGLVEMWPVFTKGSINQGPLVADSDAAFGCFRIAGA